MKAGRAAALLVVSSSTGSAPGKTGFKMAIASGQSPVGTIGGGVMEHRLIERIKDHLASGQPWTELLEQVHLDNVPEAVQSGMICAGKQLIAIHILRSDELAAVEAMARDSARGLMGLGPGGLQFREEDQSAPVSAEYWHLEPVGVRDTVSIIGGGHVGLALTKALALLDFEVHLYDHRPDVQTFSLAECQKSIVDYQQLRDLIPQGRHSLAVIVTTGFQWDAQALHQLIQMDLRFLGLMGSASKIKRIRETLLGWGVDESLFEKVQAPVGVPINNRTPAEIAVSIAAQLIKVRNAPD